jgi:hypothetical protein
MALTYDSVAVGDRVWCLAWVGKEFVVVDKDDELERVALEGANAIDPYGAQLDLFADTMWMASTEPWDQIWFWPDRAGERFNEVFQRWFADHATGDVVIGYAADVGLASVAGSVVVKPKRSMVFRITAMDDSMAQITVEPVVRRDDPGLRGEEAIGGPTDSYVPVGPRLPLRIRMVDYRWALTFGDLILNWEDLAS